MLTDVMSNLPNYSTWENHIFDYQPHQKDQVYEYEYAELGGTSVYSTFNLGYDYATDQSVWQAVMISAPIPR